TYRWSPQLAGSSAVLRVKVVGPGGTQTVEYPVRVVSHWAATAGEPRFRVTLAGASRTPTAGAPWRYVVRAVSPSGRPVNGTAVVRVVSGGRIVDTVGWFTFRGTLRNTYRWSP